MSTATPDQEQSVTRDAPVSFFSLHEYHAKSGQEASDPKLRRYIATFKTLKDGPNKGKKAVPFFVDVPRVTVTVQPACLATALQASFESLQDSLIKHLVMEKFDWANTKHRKLQVSSDEISVERVAEHAAATGLGRLTKEAIESWFKEIALTPVAEMIAAKRGCKPTDDAAIEGATAFAANFMALAKSGVVVKRKTAIALLKVCERLEELADEDEQDPMLEKLRTIVEPFTKDDSEIADLI